MPLSLTAPLLGHRPSLYSFLIQRYLVFSIHFLQAVGYSVFVEDFNRCNQTSRTRHHRRLRHPSGLDNPTDHFTSQFLSLLSSFSLAQHVTFPIHDKNHILDLVITSADTSLAPAVVFLPLVSIRSLSCFHRTFYKPSTTSSSNISLFPVVQLFGLPARRSAANPPHAAAVVDRWNRQTDGRTDARPFHRPCSTHHAGIVTTSRW